MKFKPGDHVKFLEIEGEPRLKDQTGIILPKSAIMGRYTVALDNDVPGFYSGTAWADDHELELVEESSSTTTGEL